MLVFLHIANTQKKIVGLLGVPAKVGHRENAGPD